MPIEHNRCVFGRQKQQNSMLTTCNVCSRVSKSQQLVVTTSRCLAPRQRTC